MLWRGEEMILVQTIGVFAALMSVIGVVLAASKAKRPLLRALGSAVCGAASLGAVNLLAGGAHAGAGRTVRQAGLLRGRWLCAVR